MQQTVQTFLEKNRTERVNPDEVVAVGAALQAAVLKGDVKEVFSSMSLRSHSALETLGGIFTKDNREKYNHPHKEESDILHGHRQSARCFD